MRVQITYGEDYNERQNEALDQACRILIESGIELEQLNFSGLPIPKRPRRIS